MQFGGLRALLFVEPAYRLRGVVSARAAACPVHLCEDPCVLYNSTACVHFILCAVSQCPVQLVSRADDLRGIEN
jgi:hypothetical protein